MHTLRVQDIPYVPTFAPPHYSASLVHVTPREIPAIAACQTQRQLAFVDRGVSRGRPSHSLHHDQLRQLSSHAEFALKMVPAPITRSSRASCERLQAEGNSDPDVDANLDGSFQCVRNCYASDPTQMTFRCVAAASCSLEIAKARATQSYCADTYTNLERSIFDHVVLPASQTVAELFGKYFASTCAT